MDTTIISRISSNIYPADLERCLRLVAAVAGGAIAATACSRVPVPDSGATQAPYIALHLAYPDSAAGRLRAQHGDSAIYLAQDPLLSDVDLAGARSEARPGEPLILQVHCLPVACARLAASTDQHVGSHLAVVVASQVRGVAVISGSVGAHGSLTIPIDAVGADAERIAAQVRSRWSSL